MPVEASGSMVDFTLLKTVGALAPRLGRLSVAGRKSMLTPDFIGNTSRGVIPHVSQDNFMQHVDAGGVYMALEDCRTTFFYSSLPSPALRLTPT